MRCRGARRRPRCVAIARTPESLAPSTCCVFAFRSRLMAPAKALGEVSTRSVIDSSSVANGVCSFRTARFDSGVCVWSSSHTSSVRVQTDLAWISSTLARLAAVTVASVSRIPALQGEGWKRRSTTQRSILQKSSMISLFRVVTPLRRGLRFSCA